MGELLFITCILTAIIKKSTGLRCGKHTFTRSLRPLKRPIRRMLLRMGSVESSSMLWVVTGGRECLYEGQRHEHYRWVYLSMEVYKSLTNKLNQQSISSSWIKIMRIKVSKVHLRSKNKLTMKIGCSASTTFTCSISMFLIYIILAIKFQRLTHRKRVNGL